MRVLLSLLFTSLCFSNDTFFEIQRVNYSPQGGQEWSEEPASIVSGQYQNQKIVNGINFHGSIFLYQSNSYLHGNDLTNNQLFFLPREFITRDSFNLLSVSSSDQKYQVLGFNSLYGEIDKDIFELKLGRFPITFGHGKVSNPVNPFQYKYAFSPFPKFQTANDGLHLTLKREKEFHLHIYLLGDQLSTEDHSENNKSLVLRGDWKFNHSTHLNYLLGEDQNRHFYAIELKKSFTDGMAFLQVAKTSQELETQDANNQDLFHHLIGFKYTLSHFYKIHFEHGEYEQTTNQKPFYMAATPYLALLNTFKFTDSLDFRTDLHLDQESEGILGSFGFDYKLQKHLVINIFSNTYIRDPKEEEKYTYQRSIPRILSINISLKI